MKNIEDRLKASLNYDVINGTAQEKAILEAQIKEAITELTNLRKSKE